VKDSEKVSLWRQRYFEAQAAAEEFVLREHGEEGLMQWIAQNAAISGRLLEAQRPEGQSKINHFMIRFLNQLSLYDSRVSLQETRDGLQLVNEECGILRYRGEAAAKGVELTFKSPCDYCQNLNKEIARQYAGKSSSVTCHLTDKGCHWSATGE
jgi:hypothetical protein